ncbi:MAG: TldD/PmbA family protein [Actinomycetia bacterium]|nr:TldD/PmbA family protein [Actinomycetes bacterium]
MIDNKLAIKILDKLNSGGASFSEIYIQKSISNSIRLEDGKIENSNSGFDFGCGLRVWKGESTFYGYVDSIEEGRLIEAAGVLSAAGKSSGIGKIIDLNNGLVSAESSYHISISKNPDTIKADSKKDILQNINRICREYNNKIVQVTASISDLEEEIYTANSYGNQSGQKIVKVFLSVNVVAAKGEAIRTGYQSLAGTSGYEVLDNGGAEHAAEEASRIAITMLDAVDAPAGVLPAVIGPAFGGVIFHEACGHGLEADAILKDATVFKGMTGKKIASDAVTAIDDSTMPHHWGSYKFDGEGVPSQSTILIKDGILENFIYDLRTAGKLKKEPTGNGRRQSYRHIPIPRMSNTYIAAGKSKKSDLIASIKKGIYAKEFAGGQVDPATGDFVFGISEGYLIENGKTGPPIKGATFIGNGPDILKKIEAVADDLDYAPGFCGKQGQSMANEVGQPTMKISGITVGGTGS